MEDQFEIELFPDEKKWLTEVNSFSPKTGTNSSLVGNFMLHDLLLGYNFPDDDVIYLFYEVKTIEEEKINTISMASNCAKSKNPNKENLFCDEILEKSYTPFDNMDFFESKRRSFSNFSEKSRKILPEINQNSKNNSVSLYSFSQRFPFKPSENLNASFSNIKIFNNGGYENSRFSKKPIEFEDNLTGGISQFFNNETNRNNNFHSINHEKNQILAEEAKKTKKDQHFLKINAIIDSLSKNNEVSFSNLSK